MAIFSVLHLFAFPWKTYSLKDTDPINAPGSGYSGKPHYEGGFLGLKAFMNAANPWDIFKASARGWRWLFVGVKHRREDSSYKAGGGWDTDNGVLGAVAGNDSGVYYSSTKLGPVSQGGPTSMERDRHMSRERIEDVNRRQSAERRGMAGAAGLSYTSSDRTSERDSHPGYPSGDLAEVPPQEYDTAYHGVSENGRRAYYGGELPLAPYPTYPSGNSPYPLSPHEDMPSSSARGISPLRQADESDTAGLLGNAGAAGGQPSDEGAGRHPGLRR